MWQRFFLAEGVQAPLVDMEELSRFQGEHTRTIVQLGVQYSSALQSSGAVKAGSRRWVFHASTKNPWECPRNATHETVLGNVICRYNERRLKLPFMRQ